MIGRLIKVAVVAAVIAVVVQTFPDVKRYLEMRRM
jgi:hypothetical protein